MVEKNVVQPPPPVIEEPRVRTVGSGGKNYD
jgi:hypothetical protein